MRSILLAAGGLVLLSSLAFAQPQPAGAAQFNAKCASCHNATGTPAASIATLNAMPTERIFTALLTGSMKDAAAGLTSREKRTVAEYLGKRPYQDPAAGDITKMANQCRSNPALPDLNASPAWSGWGGATNARFQTEQAAGLKATDVPKLKLKYAFGLPGGSSEYSQPGVAFGRVFVGSDDGNIYSFDAKTGCVYWSFKSDSFGRFAPIIAPISGHAGTRYAVYFVTRSVTAYAIDAQNGKLLWQNVVKDGINNLSATAAYYDGRLYVPMSGTETLTGANLD